MTLAVVQNVDDNNGSMEGNLSLTSSMVGDVGGLESDS